MRVFRGTGSAFGVAALGLAMLAVAAACGSPARWASQPPATHGTDSTPAGGGTLGFGEPAGVAPEIVAGPRLGEASFSVAADYAHFGDFGLGLPVASDQYLVVLADGAPDSAAERAAKAAGGSLAGRIEYLRVWKVRTPGAPSAEEWQRRYVALGEAEGVAAVAPITIVAVAAAPTCAASLGDPVYAGDNARPYAMIGVGGAWDAYYASGIRPSSVHLGLIDTALTRDPRGRLPWEFRQVTFAGTPKVVADPEPAGAGFHHADGVLGLIAADPTDGGIAGVASPLGARLIVSHDLLGGPLATGAAKEWTGPDGTSSSDAELLNTLHQVESGATIVNGSFAPAQLTDASAPQAAIWKAFFEKMARDHPNVLFVYAAGNLGSGLTASNAWPGGIKAPNVITVGNVLNTGQRVGHSNFVAPGSTAEVTLAAPGEQSVWGAGVNGTVHNTLGGTSSAAPMVSATAALIRSLDPTLTAAQIKAIIVASAAAGPAELGGRTLRADTAVRRAIDGVRKRAGLAPLTDDAIVKARERCELEATGLLVRRLDTPAGSGEWNVRATLHAEGTVRVSLAVDGKPPSKRDAAGPVATVAWTLTVPKDGSVVVVTRLDNGYWTSLRLVDRGQRLSSPWPTGTARPAVTPTPSPSPTPRPTQGRTPARPTESSGAGSINCSSEPPYYDPIWALACGDVPHTGG